MMASTLGLAERAAYELRRQAVGAMVIFSTAYLIHSRCGREVIPGTEPANLVNWMGNADVGCDSMYLGDSQFAVHSGFYSWRA